MRKLIRKEVFILQSEKDGKYIRHEHQPYATATEDVLSARFFESIAAAEEFTKPGTYSCRKWTIKATPKRVRVLAEVIDLEDEECTF